MRNATHEKRNQLCAKKQARYKAPVDHEAGDLFITSVRQEKVQSEAGANRFDSAIRGAAKEQLELGTIQRLDLAQI